MVNRRMGGVELNKYMYWALRTKNPEHSLPGSCKAIK